MNYKVPNWAFLATGAGTAVLAVTKPKKRMGYLLGGGIAIASMGVWNLYVEARTIETVVAQGQIYSSTPEGELTTEPAA